jgi:membrane protease YdiL (CAAX protease family)
MSLPVETKVAAGGVTGAAVSLLFGLAHWYHWFTPPPPYLTALAVTVLSGVAAWLAPHTGRLESLTTRPPT